MRQIKLHSLEFTDAPLNRQVDSLKNERRRVSRVEFEDD